MRIDCNWKLTWILPVLLERFPDARVLHLLRDPRATVQSCCDLDYYGAVPVDAATDDEPTRRRNHWLRHMPRIRRDDWDSLSQYERNCAFWSETQRLALAAEGIGRRYLRVRVEDLAGDDGAARVLEHFDLEPPPVERLQALRAAGRINAKTHEKEQVRRRGSATEVAVAAREAAFERLCGDLTRSLGYL